MTSVTTEGVRCSAWARAEGLDPVATAGCYDGFLLLEVPPPWPRDMADLAELQPIVPLARAANLRLQALVPAGPDRRAIVYTRPIPNIPFRAFVRFEATVDSYPGLSVTQLLAAAQEPERSEVGPIRDLLVCTHGRRDVCCGSLGTRLATELASARLPPDVRRWRTSHTGGHRFAPTFLVLPEATAWAYADEDLVARVLGRCGDAAEVADRYRGCAGLGSAAIQAVEREVLRATGWGLLDRPRLGVEHAGGRVGLRVGEGRGAEEWEAMVAPGRVLPVPDCGRPIEDAKKADHEWVVRNLRRI